MGLSFLAPLFFAGLAALAIPIIVHLTYRQKATVVPFPSLMFLQKVPFRSLRRQKIRHWLLFLTRCLAILLLVTAFTRPFFDRAGITSTLSAASREVVILVDNSYSMTYGDRWERALAAARRTINGLSASDRASLVVFSDAAQLAVRSTPETSVLSGALEALSISRRPTRYAPAFGMAQQLLVESDLPAREVVLITDYQKSGWDAGQAVRLPEETDLVGVDITTEESSNLSVATLLLQREVTDDGEHFVVTARLTNQGKTAFNNVEVALEIEGERAEVRRVSLEGNSAANVQFRPQPVGGSAIRGTVVAADDALPGDNRFHFMINPGETLSVLLLENPGAHDTDSFFFEHALSVSTRPAFDVRRKPSNQLTSGDLDGVSLVVLNDTAFPSGALGSDVRAYVENGGGLLVALGELARPGRWQGADASALVPAFGGNQGDPINRSGDSGGSMASYDRTHPVFEVFRVPRSGDFTAASFYRYWPLEAGPNDLVLAGFDDGSPAVVTRNVGEGRVIVWPTSLDTYWNDLVTQPVFVPFIHSVTQFVAGYREAASWQTVGGTVRLAAVNDAAIPSGTRVTVTSPSGSRRELVSGAESSATVDGAVATGRIDVDEPGFYELEWSDDTTERRSTLAANLDRRESDLSKIDAEELSAAVRWRGAEGGDLQLVGLVAAEDREARQSFWWYLLILLFLALALETVLSNRLSPSSATHEA